jgi:hypothetical protein
VKRESKKRTTCYLSEAESREPKDVHILISRVLQSRRNPADVINLRILRWGNCPRLLDGPMIHMSETQRHKSQLKRDLKPKNALEKAREPVLPESQ